MAKRHKASDGSAESEPFENSMQTGGSIASDGSDIPELFLDKLQVHRQGMVCPHQI